MGTDSSNYGKMDIFESIYQYLYFLLFLLSIVNHHSSESRPFICDNNENDFMNGKQRTTLLKLTSFWFFEKGKRIQ
jgi:hypothetical protein